MIKKRPSSIKKHAAPPVPPPTQTQVQLKPIGVFNNFAKPSVVHEMKLIGKQHSAEVRIRNNQ